MTETRQNQKTVVETINDGSLVIIKLNRPNVLNSLNLEMIRQIKAALVNAESNNDCQCVLLCGAGERAFCAGGDIKALTRWAREDDFASVEQFFEEEYALDLYIHNFPKPLLVLADGITMGGGLGVAAGADMVIATECTRMAMPETGIGFFPDVGATRWLFDKCRKGYPEFLGLTGREMKGADTVCCGLATHLLPLDATRNFMESLKKLPNSVPGKRKAGISAIRSLISQACESPTPSGDLRDHWIEEHFTNKSSLREIVSSLSGCASQDRFCQKTLETLRQRSPTALMLTFTLFRINRKRPLKDVFRLEQKAASFMIRHPDYLEGVRAQILEKDYRPQWNPKTIEEVKGFDGFFG